MCLLQQTCGLALSCGIFLLRLLQFVKHSPSEDPTVAVVRGQTLFKTTQSTEQLNEDQIGGNNAEAETSCSVLLIYSNLTFFFFLCLILSPKNKTKIHFSQDRGQQSPFQLKISPFKCKY